ncbi:MAG: hypothetical protein WCR72_04935 [Bacteroidota bacterium]
MTKVKIEKNIKISFIVLIVTVFAALGGNFALKAGSPATSPKPGINYENRLQLLEKDLASGKVSRVEFDSLSELLHAQILRNEALQIENHNPDKMPEWVTKLGISEPSGMKFDQVFSNSTSVDNSSEGFNSVSLVYTGSYEIALEDARKIAEQAKIPPGRIFKAKGSPTRNADPKLNSEVSYLNYSLGKADQDYLISIQVEPSGRLIIMVTDNKQLSSCLLAYEPLNNRLNVPAKRKKL